MHRGERIGIVLVAVHLALALGLGYWLSVWIDEGFTLATTGAGPVHAWRQARDFELQPPLYFVALSLWRLVDDSFGFARAFSALCTAGALGLLAFARDPRRRALAGLLAIHPFMLWAASEARVYGLVLLEVVAVVVLFARAYRDPHTSRGARVGVTVVATCGIYTHYYFGFLLPALGATLLAGRNRRSLWWFGVDMLAVAVICLPLAFSLSRQIEAHHALASIPTELPRVLTELFWRIRHYVLPSWPTMLAHTWWEQLRGILWLAMLLGGAAVLLQRRSQLELGFLVVTAILLGEFAVLRTLTSPELFASRHTVVLFIPLFLSVCAILDGTAEGLARVIFAVLLAIALVASWAQFSSGQKTGYFGDVARFLESHESAQQPILIVHADRLLPLQQHYHGINRLVPFPRPLRMVAEYKEDYVIHSAAELDQAFAAVGRQTTIWLVMIGPARYLGTDFRHEMLEDWIATRFVTTVDQMVGPDTRVRRLELMPR